MFVWGCSEGFRSPQSPYKVKITSGLMYSIYIEQAQCHVSDMSGFQVKIT